MEELHTVWGCGLWAPAPMGWPWVCLPAQLSAERAKEGERERESALRAALLCSPAELSWLPGAADGASDGLSTRTGTPPRKRTLRGLRSAL